MNRSPHYWVLPTASWSVTHEYVFQVSYRPFQVDVLVSVEKNTTKEILYKVLRWLSLYGDWNVSEMCIVRYTSVNRTGDSS